MKKDSIIIAISVLVAAGVILAAVVCSLHKGKATEAIPTPLPTPLAEAAHTWSTYINPKRDFTPEYPSDILTPREGDATEPSVVVFERSAPDATKGEGVEAIQIDSEPTTYSDAAAYYAQYPTEGLVPTTIAGLPALKQVDTMHPITMIFFVHGGRLYTLMMNLSPKDMQRVQQSFGFKADKQADAGFTPTPGSDEAPPPPTLGIQDPIDQDVVGKNMVLGTNSWWGYVDGELTTVTGTAYRDDPSHGVLFVWEPDNGIGSSRMYPAPTATGPLKIVSEADGVLTAQSLAGTYEVYDINTDTRTYVTTPGGTTYTFDIASRTFR